MYGLHTYAHAPCSGFCIERVYMCKVIPTHVGDPFEQGEAGLGGLAGWGLVRWIWMGHTDCWYQLFCNDGDWMRALSVLGVLLSSGYANQMGCNSCFSLHVLFCF